ncbi:MAG: GNAT family N-acetyltransferase [Candidatus Lokiarchaeota archaeon]|nr:GNAT family N-acetyltransferase [Candidatus Lokiarchaeota archaeon]MBD3200808.1 GNAT family N-acetyltransferase [Candidatus Lokiarchaeota archaeon]
MKFFFRELKEQDIPQINEISKNIWEGEDYVPYIIDDWLNDEQSFNYGVFSDKEKTILIAFGRIKFLSESLYWLEGGRVRKDFQGKGIGTQMMEFSLNYCKKNDIGIIQYDTASTNEASVALAEKYGFQKKLSMYVLEASPKLNSLINTDSSDYKLVKKLDLETALSKYREILPEKQSEICIGWSYIPLRLKHLKSNEWRWISMNDGILHEISKKRKNHIEGTEKSEIWFITYGNVSSVEKLVKFAINDVKNREIINELDIFCEEKHLSSVKKLGFKFWEDTRVKVVLFEKNVK